MNENKRNEKTQNIIDITNEILKIKKNYSGVSNLKGKNNFTITKNENNNEKGKEMINENENSNKISIQSKNVIETEGQNQQNKKELKKVNGKVMPKLVPQEGVNLKKTNAMENALAYSAQRKNSVEPMALKGVGKENAINIDQESSSFSTLSSTLSAASLLPVVASSSSSPLIDSMINQEKDTFLLSKQTVNPIMTQKQKMKVVKKKTKLPQEYEKNFFNLYWIKNSRLPCIYYDTLGGEERDKFMVLPICCTTYHYTVMVRYGYIDN